MERCEFSIIIPVYNAASFLETCLNSIMRQSFTNWELLIIDDGSTDCSWEIISAFQKKDNRIKAFQQENKGPGSARNIGIDNAVGEYIIFIDSDDYIDSDYLNLLEECKRKCDVVFIDVLRVDEKGNAIELEKMSDYHAYDKDSLLRSVMTGKIPWGGVRKVVRRELIERHGIRYSNIRIGEEAVFSFNVLYWSKQYTFLSSKPVYMYVERNNSQSKLVDDDPWGETWRALRQELIDRELYTDYADTLNAFNVSSTVVSMDRICKYYNGKDRIKKLQKRNVLYRQRNDERYAIDYKNLDAKAKILIPFLRHSVLFPILIASRVKLCIDNCKKH